MSRSLAAPGPTGAPGGSLAAPDVETSSDGYARRFAGGVGAWFLETQARITLDLLTAWPGARILDVGGGHGQLTGPLVEAGYDVTVYGSEVACASRIRAWTDAGRARFLAGPLERLAVDDRQYDVVLSYRLLPHVSVWRALIVCRPAVAKYSTIAAIGTLITPRRRNVVAVRRSLSIAS